MAVHRVLEVNRFNQKEGSIFSSINKLQELDRFEGIPSKPMQMIFNDLDQDAVPQIQSDI